MYYVRRRFTSKSWKGWVIVEPKSNNYDRERGVALDDGGNLWSIDAIWSKPGEYVIVGPGVVGEAILVSWAVSMSIKFG